MGGFDFTTWIKKHLEIVELFKFMLYLKFRGVVIEETVAVEKEFEPRLSSKKLFAESRD